MTMGKNVRGRGETRSERGRAGRRSERGRGGMGWNRRCPDTIIVRINKYYGNIINISIGQYSHISVLFRIKKIQ